VIDQLVEQVRAIASRVALELQWETFEHDDESIDWMLELHVVCAEPGPQHSALSTTRLHAFRAESLDERREAHRVANAVAQATGLALHARPVEEHGGQAGSNVVRAAPMGAEVGYALEWTASWWKPDGTRHDAAGSDVVDGASGELACDELLRRLARYPHRPLTIEIRGPEVWRNRQLDGDPAFTPVPRALRTLARTHECRASVIAREFPAAGPLALMLGFMRAFGGSLDHYVALVRWRAGALDDSALDAALDERIAGHRREWERPHLIEERWLAHESVAAFIRSERTSTGRIQLIRDLRDVFPISLPDAENFVYLALEGRTDAELDASLELLRVR
jgi:hypothetical protein